jgi:hypothetical protein
VRILLFVSLHFELALFPFDLSGFAGLLLQVRGGANNALDPRAHDAQTVDQPDALLKQCLSNSEQCLSNV